MIRRYLIAFALLAAIVAMTLPLQASRPVFAQNTPQNAIWFKPITLLTTQKTTGTLYPWPGGQGICQAWGTWNGATVTFQNLTQDGTTLLTMGSTCTMTANAEGVFYLPAGLIQATISSSGASTSLSASIQIIPYPTIPVAR